MGPMKSGREEQSLPLGGLGKKRHSRVRIEPFQSVAAPFPSRFVGCDLWGGGADAAGRAVSLRAARRLKDGQNGTPHFAKRNETFRTHVASHWNPYERRISDFAGSFVFEGLAPFSFRCSHGLFDFNAL